MVVLGEWAFSYGRGAPVYGPGIVQINTWSNRIYSALAFVWLYHAKVLGGSSVSNGTSYKDPCLRIFLPTGNTPKVHMDIPKEFNPFLITDY